MGARAVGVLAGDVLVAFVLPVADQVATIAAHARGEMATGRRSTEHGRRAAIDPPSTDHDVKAIAPRSIALALQVTGHLSIARALPVTGHRSTDRGVTIGRVPTAQGSQIDRRLMARAVNFVRSPIDLDEIQARRRNALDAMGRRTIGRGKTALGGTLDRPSNAVLVVAAGGRTRIARAGLAPMAGATGPHALRADRHGLSRTALQGHRTSTQASSSVRETSWLPDAGLSRRHLPLDARRCVCWLSRSGERHWTRS